VSTQPGRLPRGAPRRPYLQREYVPVAPLREAFLQSGMSLSELARRMGMVRTQPNANQAARTLGLRPDTNSRDGVRDVPREFVSPRMAQRIADALELDYHDVGL
jgi:transcriptional regulator with XRE-family HTH domain